MDAYQHEYYKKVSFTIYVYVNGICLKILSSILIYSFVLMHHKCFLPVFQVRGPQTVDGQVFVGVSAHGLAVYKDRLAVYRWPWQRILHFSYTRNGFKITIRPKVTCVLNRYWDSLPQSHLEENV